MLILNKKLLSEANVTIVESTLLSSFDPSEFSLSNIPNLQSLNLQSIAKVCSTDQKTVELVITELMAQLAACFKRGDNLRMGFKVGRLVARGGQLNWKPVNDQADQNQTQEDDQASRFSRTGTSMVSSVHRKDLSVVTPSVFSRMRSTGRNTVGTSAGWHAANPNPQLGSRPYQGVREMGYEAYLSSTDPLQEMMRFGKKVACPPGQTSEQLMQEHLRQMREKLDVKNLAKSQKLS